MTAHRAVVAAKSGCSGMSRISLMTSTSTLTATRRPLSFRIQNSMRWSSTSKIDHERSFSLPDGRTLGFFESGDPKGTPVVYIHGTPDSGVQVCGKSEDETAMRLGIRWIGPDRPGIGVSTHQADRTALDYPADVEYLLDYLGLESVYLLGTSGGSACTLACAMKLSRRLRGVGICAGAAPMDREGGFHGVGLAERQAFERYKVDPEAIAKDFGDHIVPLAQSGDLDAMKDCMRAIFGKGLKDRDHEAILAEDSLTSAARGWMQVYKQGTRGHVRDLALLLRPWGFSIEQVGYSGIKLWYGGDDENTPLQMGRYIASRLPDAVYKEYSNESHYTIWLEGRLEEMLQDLVQEAA